ncbi:MAG TPA: TOPRIM nucleotidyl transferase/hydrolase domain-containing protein [Solirubrobacteraceae bacterium]|nr:TOPRIM nucleotidyl transferase/hydrolase domain-containing protein [Solirubrobacteraceae bacterium]
MAGSRFGVGEVRIRGFRSARSVRFAPGPVCALVGGPSVGKSNVLAAVWMLLQQGAPEPGVEDVSAGGGEAIHLSATLGDGDEISLEASPPESAKGSGRPVPVLFLPASLRSGRLLAEPTRAPAATRVASDYFAVERGASPAAAAAALLAGLERLCGAGEQGLILLIEEPELFLRPQAQRYLYRLLRAFAENGNQVLYSTHEPAFLNVGRLEELALVEHSPTAGTTVVQPEPLGAEESFRALSELDAERGELLLARAVLLVEGRTEKLTFPFVFRALGQDADREAITIVDCGGKPNVPLFIRICHAARIPCLVVHDRDAPPGRRPSRGERVLNTEIAELAGSGLTIVLAPDFEAVAGLRGHRHKPARAWQLFSRIERDQVPPALTEAVEKVLALARA